MPKREDKSASLYKVRLAQKLYLPAFTQVKAKVRTTLGGLILLEPHSDMQTKYRVRAMNAVHDVVSGQPFSILLSNFSSKNITFPKGMVVAFAAHTPVSLVSLTGPASQVLCAHLNIPSETLPVNTILEDQHDNLTEVSAFDHLSEKESASKDAHPEQTEPASIRDASATAQPDENGLITSTPQAVIENGPPASPQPSLTEQATLDDDHKTDWKDAVNLSHMHNRTLRDKLWAVLSKHVSMYTGTLGTVRATEHRIDLKPGTKPIHMHPYRAGPKAREFMEEQINTQLKTGVIEPAQSEWASPVVLAPKKDGTLRFCVDYRRLNAATIPDTYPLPRMDDSIDSLGQAKIFSVLDALWGYWQVPISEEDRDKTTFTTHMGTYRYARMPFGLRNAPATFQRALEILLSGVRWRSCLVYIDDVIIFSQDGPSHLKHLDEVLTLLEEGGVKLKLKKCDFFKTSVEYLGHLISPGTLSVPPESKASAAVCEATFPQDVTQMKSFLGACNVYRRFIKDFAKIAVPLNSMVTKDASPDWTNPEPDQEQAFETLKAKLASPPILALPQPNREYMIDCDASSYAIGVVLLQQQDDKKPNDWATVGYFSKTLTKEQRNYSPTERECFAVIWAVITLRPYLEGSHFKVRTDHSALRWLMTLNDPAGRLMRWRLRLMEFDYEITYRPGRLHQVPDALSRIPREQTQDSTEVDDDIPAITDFPEHTVNALRRQAARAQSQTEDKESTSKVEEGVRLKPLVRPTKVNDGSRTSRWFDTCAVSLPTEPDDAETDANELVRLALDIVHHQDTLEAPASDEPLPAPLTLDEILETQRSDDFCQQVALESTDNPSSSFFEDHDGVLCRKQPADPTRIQIVLPEVLRPRLLRLAHHSPLAGHPGQTRLHHRLSRSYYWPQMAADVATTVRECSACAKNRLRLIRNTSPMLLFPATNPLESVAIDILGPLPKSKRGFRFILVIADRFTKLTQVVPLRKITAYDVAVAFVEHWVFKYGPPKTLLSDNGSQFVAHFFQRVCRILGTNNAYTTTYHPQTNGQVERFNRSLLAMLRCYVEDNPEDWCLMVHVLTFAYNMSVHRSTGTTPFELVLTRYPPEFTLAHNANRLEAVTNNDRADFASRLGVCITKARNSLLKSQARYKRNYDKRLRKTTPIRVHDSVFLDISDPAHKTPKLTHSVSGPYRVLDVSDNTAAIQRGEVVERVTLDRLTNAPLAAEPELPDGASPKDFVAKRKSGPTWLMNGIMDHREKPDGTLEFRISWEGDYEPTWEPRENIPEETISRYLAKYRRLADSPRHT